MTFVDLAIMAIWPHTFIAGALYAVGRGLLAIARWLRARRQKPPELHLTRAQVDRVIANFERELQQDRS